MILEAIFLPPSKADFQFKKQTHVGSAKALLFTFHVAAANNRYYFLFAGDKKWFPQYSGELWIDENGFRLLQLERETRRMAQYPIRFVKTTIQYAPVSLADGSTLVLPLNSEVNTCTPAGRLLLPQPGEVHELAQVQGYDKNRNESLTLGQIGAIRGIRVRAVCPLA